MLLFLGRVSEMIGRGHIETGLSLNFFSLYEII